MSYRKTSQSTATGPYGWANSPYDPSSGAGAAGVSQTVNGVQIIPGRAWLGFPATLRFKVSTQECRARGACSTA